MRIFTTDEAFHAAALDKAKAVGRLCGAAGCLVDAVILALADGELTPTMRERLASLAARTNQLIEEVA